MKIYLSSSTAGKGGGGLKGNLSNFDKFIQNELDNSDFNSSFDELCLTLVYPPLNIRTGIAVMAGSFMEYYEELPYARLNRKYKKIDIALKAHEFSEHFEKKESSGFVVESRDKSISDTDLAGILINKYLEALSIIKSKLKKEDSFDFITLEKILLQVKEKITPDFLSATAKEQNTRQQELQIEIAELKRAERQKRDLPKDKPIRDIRLFFAYRLPADLFYLNRFADIVLKQLIAKDFRCPHYDHLYISIAGTKEDALKGAIPAENWYTYGIAVLKEETLLQESHPEQQQLLILYAIQEGLLDIAALDNLDKAKIIEAVQEAKEIGILSEIIFKAKENKKIAFVITTRTILGANKEEIYFTLTDKEKQRMVKWKFGEENIFLIIGWFRTITVTNKVVKIKPRAHMDLVLKGKQMCLEIDVEKELGDLSKVG
jgi:hypothetical protein